MDSSKTNGSEPDTHAADTQASASVPGPLTVQQTLGRFCLSMFAVGALSLGGYALLVDTRVQASEIPGTYKWFLLKTTPGPRIIFESGSNSHHALDTDAIGKAMGMTAINIADNAGYALEDKVTRLETYTRPGDIVVLPLEWSFYHREKLTDNYVETLFNSNRDYYRSMPAHKRLQRALSLPPSKVAAEFFRPKSETAYAQESPAKDLFLSALTQSSGHLSQAKSRGPEEGVAEQSCDEYALGDAAARKRLMVARNIAPALNRLQALKARGVAVHFAWPVLAGDGCLMAQD